MNPAALTPILPKGTSFLSWTHGGNLARATFTRAGHFSFRETAKQFVAHHTDPDERAALLLPGAARRTGAAIMRQLPPFPAAKSRPSLFPEVDYITHSTPPFLSSSGTAIPEAGRLIREERNDENR